MTIKKPEPYCWAAQSPSVCWTWRGDNAELLARQASATSNLSQPFPLYKEPPVTEESSATQPGGLTQDDDLAAVYLAGMSRGKELAIKSKVELTKIYWEGDKLKGTVKAPADFLGLTYDEVVDLIKEAWGCASIAPQKVHSFACAIEAKLKEKNQ
jgi:hypothetical protein